MRNFIGLCGKVFLVFCLFLIFVACKTRTEEKGAPDPVAITHTVLLETSEGNILLGLYGNGMPMSVSNFINYVKDGFYDGLIFHRVVKNFVIQGGGFDTDMIQKETRPPVKLEMPPSKEVEEEPGRKLKKLLISHDKYALSMARTGVPDSATSQFFITLAPTKNLDPNPNHSQPNGYAVFGKVIEGFEVVDKIGEAKVTMKKGHRDVPEENITISRASVVSEPEKKETK
jgi:cyclophilin family peptidyl-prolyl cis-trans isomerase